MDGGSCSELWVMTEMISQCKVASSLQATAGTQLQCPFVVSRSINSMPLGVQAPSFGTKIERTPLAASKQKHRAMQMHDQSSSSQAHQ